MCPHQSYRPSRPPNFFFFFFFTPLLSFFAQSPSPLVLHHLSSTSRRMALLREAIRLLRVGGRALFYAWALEQSYQEPDGTAKNTGENEREEDEKDDSGHGEKRKTEEGQGKGNNKHGVSGHRFQQPDVLVPFHFRLDLEPERSTAAAKASITSSSSSSSSSSSTTSSTSSSFAASHGICDSDKGSVVFRRYCHVYQKGEVEELLLQAVGVSAVRILESYYDTGNWCVMVEKIGQGEPGRLTTNEADGK